MKINNKGFTVVELLASFVLTMVIVVFLFEIVLELRNVYINESVRTEVINKNAVVANSVNKLLEDKSITGVNCTGSACTITTVKSVTSETATTDVTEISVSNNTVTINKQKIVFPDKTKLTNISLTKNGPLSTDLNADNSIIKIGYDIESADLNKTIEFRLVYTYRG